MKSVTTLFLMFLLIGSAFADRCISGDCQNGKGATISENNVRYIGPFKNGLRDGKGVLSVPGLFEYVGEFKSGRIEGQGRITWANGSVYTGGFKNGKYHGFGTYLSSYGINSGQWANGLFVGK